MNQLKLKTESTSNITQNNKENLRPQTAQPKVNFSSNLFKNSSATRPKTTRAMELRKQKLANKYNPQNGSSSNNNNNNNSNNTNHNNNNNNNTNHSNSESGLHSADSLSIGSKSDKDRESVRDSLRGSTKRSLTQGSLNSSRNSNSQPTNSSSLNSSQHSETARRTRNLSRDRASFTHAREKRSQSSNSRSKIPITFSTSIDPAAHTASHLSTDFNVQSSLGNTIKNKAATPHLVRKAGSAKVTHSESIKVKNPSEAITRTISAGNQGLKRSALSFKSNNAASQENSIQPGCFWEERTFEAEADNYRKNKSKSSLVFRDRKDKNSSNLAGNESNLSPSYQRSNSILKKNSIRSAKNKLQPAASLAGTTTQNISSIPQAASQQNDKNLYSALSYTDNVNLKIAQMTQEFTQQLVKLSGQNDANLTEKINQQLNLQMGNLLNQKGINLTGNSIDTLNDTMPNSSTYPSMRNTIDLQASSSDYTAASLISTDGLSEYQRQYKEYKNSQNQNQPSNDEMLKLIDDTIREGERSMNAQTTSENSSIERTHHHALKPPLSPHHVGNVTADKIDRVSLYGIHVLSTEINRLANKIRENLGGSLPIKNKSLEAEDNFNFETSNVLLKGLVDNLYEIEDNLRSVDSVLNSSSSKSRSDPADQISGKLYLC